MRITVRDHERFEEMGKIEASFRDQGFKRIAGLDEAGRGPLAGPVACAACILDPEQAIFGLNDSKKIAEKRREYLRQLIQEKALAFSVVLLPAERIDEINILNASKEGMRQAAEALSPAADLLLIDALHLPDLPVPQRAIIKGDAQVNAIAAASILAKTERDAYMRKLDLQYPVYAFAKNKGYGTAEHLEALKKYGPCPEHRLSFLSHFRMGEENYRRTNSGYQAEKRVEEHLAEQGYCILSRNFRLLPFGEIDLIASHGETLFIIEVKARKGENFVQAALDAVPRQKRSRLRALGGYFAQSRGQNKKQLRLLLAACLLGEDDRVKKIRFIELDT